MKILKIRFKNINALRGEHEVDFTKAPLAGSGLFAITGPTGSGKSTLLDVITLALFNRVPRLGKTISKNFVAQSGALLTRNTQEAYASVDYECHSGAFRSTWSISVNRNGKLRDYELELISLDKGQHIDLKKGEVPAKNELLIGLNYDQFVKSILLAQGEFAQFLKVSKSERGELLEKITGTGIYRELGKKAFEKKQQFGKELERLRERKSTFEEQLLGEDELAEVRQLEGQFKEKLNTHEDSLKKLDAQLRLRQEIGKLEQKKLELLKTLEECSKQLETFRVQNAGKLEWHEKTVPFATGLEEWKNRQGEQQRLHSQIAELKESQAILEGQGKEVHREIESLLKKTLSTEDSMEELESFRQEVLKLDQQYRDKKSDYSNYGENLKASARNFGFTPNLKAPDKDLSKLRVLEIENAARLKELSESLKDFKIEELDRELEQLDHRADIARKGQQWSQEMEKANTRCREEEVLLQRLAEEAGKLPERLKKLREAEKTAGLEVKSLQLEIENQKLRASLEAHRQHLKEGEPCPLCGAEEHPWAEDVPATDDVLPASLKDAESKLVTLTRELVAAETEAKNLEVRRKEIVQGLEKINGEITQHQDNLQRECGEWLNPGPVDWVEVINQLREQGRALKSFGELRKQQQELTVCIPLLEKMIAVADEGKEIGEKRRKLFEGENVDLTTGRLREQWQTVHHKLDNLKGNLKRLQDEEEKLDKRLDHLSRELLPGLQEVGFENVQQALEKRLSEKEYLELSTQLNNLKQALNSAEVAMKSMEENLAELRSGLTEEETSVLQQQFSDETVAREEVRKQLQDAQRKLVNHHETVETIRKLDEQIRAEEKTGRKWELLCNLIGDATGKKFNDFAQDLTLRQLLVLANRRMQGLSDRYLIDKPTDDEDDSLIAIDEHMGGQRRSVKTLSGGETFVLSLSLALALSDLAAKDVTINSLFIDEGFGTLDPETLDQTLDTLERLQAESSKTIGIISHVEALKERISTQIRLVRNGQGYSRLEVV